MNKYPEFVHYVKTKFAYTDADIVQIIEHNLVSENKPLGNMSNSELGSFVDHIFSLDWNRWSIIVYVYMYIYVS